MMGIMFDTKKEALLSWQGRRLLSPLVTAASVWPRPGFSLLRARRLLLLVAMRRRWIKRSPNSEPMRVATALMSPLRKTASGSSQPLAKISGNSTLSLPTPESQAERPPA
jgi:hypothetical protein